VPLTDSVFSQPDRWLETTVNGETVLPRTRLTSVGYAHRVGTVDQATGGEMIGDLVILSSAEIPAGAALSEEQLAAVPRIEFTFGSSGSGSVSLYEPIDSRGLAFGAVKRWELLSNGLVMFGNSEDDTTLTVSPNGDITGVGQITMGQNSSDGFHTSVLGFENTADGDSSTIGGGSLNVTTGALSVIAGGHANTATGEGSVISGGSFNAANGAYSFIGGGQYNQADGDHSVIPGGLNNTTGGTYAFAGGMGAQAAYDGSFVWSDGSTESFAATGLGQFIIQAGGGVGIGTANPGGEFEVAGPDVDGSVILPGNAISSPEILNEAGIASNKVTNGLTLTQGLTQFEELTQVTITLPAPGYVVLRGGATMESSNTTGANQAFIQLDETPGGGLIPGQYTVAGSGDHDSPNSIHYFSLSVEHIVFKDSGTYTFYLEGLANPANKEDAVTILQGAVVTANYFPTSYGTVSSIVASSEAFKFNSTESADAWAKTVPVETSGSPYYQVDLRELEEEAARLKAAADEAERRLREAQAGQR
jgi:hypothetical protein